jgi:hypothetical protein
MCGVIPSPSLEECTSGADVHEFVDRVLETVDGPPTILGVSDIVVGNDPIERVEWAARRIDEHVL